jgi:hypothetical protein
MKLSGNIYIVFLALLLIAGCDKKDKLQYFANGNAPRLLVDASTIAVPSADSNNNVLNLRWSRPGYVTDTNNVKFLLQIDSLGKNFANAIERELTAEYSYEFTAKELNEELMSRGFPFEREVSLQIRVVSSYLNNNDPLESNVVDVKVTPYRPAPKTIPPPTGRLFIVGDASDFGWTNNPTPVFDSARELTRVDTTTWVGIFHLRGTGAYKFLYRQGDWDSQYHRTGGDDSTGTFTQRNADPAFLSPPAAGYYKVTLDFQEGTFLVQPFNQLYDVPDSLFIVGTATPGGLANPVPVPSQQFLKLTSTRFQLDSLLLEPNRFYSLILDNGDWTRSLGQSDASANTPLSGTFTPNGGDFLSPAERGRYGITIDFRNNSYQLQRQ